MADTQKIRQIIPTVAAVLLFFVCLVLGAQNKTLQQKNEELAERSKALGASLSQAEENIKLLTDRSQKSDAEKETLQRSLSDLKSEYDNFKVDFQKLETQWKAATEEKTYLEEMLINKNKAIDILKKSPAINPVSVTAATGDSQDLLKQIQEKDDEIKKLDEQNKILTGKLERLYTTTQNKIREITVAKIALEDTVSSAKAKIEEEWNTVDLGSISANSNLKPSGRTDKTSPKKEGRVLALNEEHGFVVIDLGKNDVSSDKTLFSVRQNNEAIATLSILEIRDEMSACNVKDLKEGAKIQVNDPVIIQ